MSDPTMSADEGGTHGHESMVEPTDRRGFLVWAAAATLGSTALFIGATVVQAMVPPTRSADGRLDAGRVVVARISDLKLNVPRLTDYGSDKVFVVKTSGTKVLVFDAACPHMGCELDFSQTSGKFSCPCHKSTFTLTGKRLSGPARRNMISAESEVVNGEVVVSGLRA